VARMAAMQKAMCSSMGTPSLFGALADVVAINAAGEALSFSLRFTESGSTSKMLLPGLTREQAVRNPANSSQANSVCSSGVSRGTRYNPRGEDRANHFLGIATLTQDCRAASRVFFRRTVGVVWPAFVIEIVQESGEPQRFSSAPVFRA